MMPVFHVDTADPTPLYAQIERTIRSAIATGRLRVGDQLPTVRQLAVDLRVNANTVAKVYGELERAGVVETRRGVGTFVREPDPPPAARADREPALRALVEQFLAGAAANGFSATEAAEYLVARLDGHGSNPAS
jgi:GntR family transcriptional regulator